MHQPSRQPERSAETPTPPPAEALGTRLPAHTADELGTAQTRVYEAYADVAQARADLAHSEAALGEAITAMNTIVTSLLLKSTGQRLGK
ncbi:hypothetical protein [Streptomyces sp. 030-HV]|uniref:hypothetical protein n=1 Tax=Streptomyces sp. 030-HV TaxID=2789262 RepID=UPI00397FD478